MLRRKVALEPLQLILNIFFFEITGALLLILKMHLAANMTEA